jgi:apolipoprotein N-acyltransferase
MHRVALLSPIWRLVVAVLIGVGGLTLPTYVLSLVLLSGVPPVVMIRSFVVGTLLPLAVAWGLLRAFAGQVGLRGGRIELRRGDVAIDVPPDALAAVLPWWIPLPRPGLWLRLRTGGRVPLGVAVANPSEVLALLASAGVDTTAASRHPNAVWAATRPMRRWWGPLLKFVAFGLLPASVLFYTHQHIAYGGTFGQWYLEGPRAWWTTFALYWATTAILLVSYASFWRAGAELVVWITAAAAPGAAATVRRLAEAICAIAYYAGVPALLALRYAG